MLNIPFMFKNRFKIFILIAFIFISIFASGCAENNDATKASETLPQAQQFMVDSSDADTNVKYYADSEIPDGHSQEWEKNVTPTAIHKIVVDDSESTGRSTTTVPVGNASITVKLQDSMDSPIIDGVVKYYSEGWNEFGTTDEKGQVKKELPIGTYQFRMTYENASSDISQDIEANATVVFSTVNTTVELRDSTGNLMDAGSVKYYSGDWYDLGTTTDGIVSRELLPNTYKFRMTYEHASKDLSQDIGANATVAFSTVKTIVQLMDSNNNSLDAGSVKYYSGDWYDLGTTTDGNVSRELLPNTYKFRMTYEHASKDLSQDIGANATVAFSTVNTIVQLMDSNNNSLDTGNVKYYSGGWYDLGTTTDGNVSRELLPNTYKFRMTYEHASKDLSQDIGTDETVVFSTVMTTVGLRDSNDQLVDAGSVKYYSGGWHDFGTATDGSVSRELLPNTYKFRMTYEYASNDISQDIGTDETVVFSTVMTTVGLRDSNDQLVDAGSVKYYSGGWHDFGTTTDGSVSRELLPNRYIFKMTYEHASNDRSQDIGTDPTVVFSTVNTTVQLRDSNGNLLDTGTVKYYSGGWYDFGTTTDGNVSRELLPNRYTFNMNYDHASKEIYQDIGTNATVAFSTVNTTVQLMDSNGNSLDTGIVKYYSGGWYDFGTTTDGNVSRELLPNRYTFNMNYDHASKEIYQDIGTNATVAFSTVNTIIELRDSDGNLMDTGSAKYYSGGWYDFGTTSDGIVSRELLPNTYRFFMTYEFTSNDIYQDIRTYPKVVFSTVKVISVSGACTHYYSAGWQIFTEDMEMLPGSYKFSFADETPDAYYNVEASTTKNIH